MDKGPTTQGFMTPGKGVGPYPKEPKDGGLVGFIFLKCSFKATVVESGVTGVTSGHWQASW